MRKAECRFFVFVIEDCSYIMEMSLFAELAMCLCFSRLSQACSPLPTGMSIVCSPPDPVPTPSCLSWLAGMVKTVCWELEPPEWILSIPGDRAQYIPDLKKKKSG